MAKPKQNEVNEVCHFDGSYEPLPEPVESISARALRNIDPPAHGLPEGALDLAGGRFEIVRQVNFPILHHEQGETVYITILTAPQRAKRKMAEAEAEAAKAAGADAPKNQPPYVAKVVNLVDGREYRYCVNAVLRSLLEDEYPDDAYLNRSFAVMKERPAGGKRHCQINAVEIIRNDEGRG